MKPGVVFLAPKEKIDLVFGANVLDEVRKKCRIIATFLPDYSIDTIKNLIRDADIILSTWGMPRLTSELVKAASKLKIIIYGASSVKHFVHEDLFRRSIVVTSAASANGRVVAEFTVAVMTLCLKNLWFVVGSPKKIDAYFRREVPWSALGGFEGATIGIIGASAVGREVIKLLSSYPCDIMLFDPFLDEYECSALGAQKVTLENLFSNADIVSLHAPLLEELRHMVNEQLLRRMKDGSWFINTARGALVDEIALIRELESGRINAVLDVTDPEPPSPASRLYTLPNVVVTPHIAGAIGSDCKRMGDLCLRELNRYLCGKDPLYPVTWERLRSMA